MYFDCCGAVKEARKGKVTGIIFGPSIKIKIL